MDQWHIPSNCRQCGCGFFQTKVPFHQPETLITTAPYQARLLATRTGKNNNYCCIILLSKTTCLTVPFYIVPSYSSWCLTHPEESELHNGNINGYFLYSAILHKTRTHCAIHINTASDDDYVYCVDFRWTEDADAAFCVEIEVQLTELNTSVREAPGSDMRVGYVSYVTCFEGVVVIWIASSALL